jgi:hypothetical protein
MNSAPWLPIAILVAATAPGCMIAGVDGGAISFEAYDLSGDYAPTPERTMALSDPPKAMLTPLTDVVLVPFYESISLEEDEPKYQVVGTYRLRKEGRHLSYPPRPFVMIILGAFDVRCAGTAGMGVLALAPDRPPVMLTDGSGWIPYEGNFERKEFMEPRERQLKGYEAPPGTKGVARVIFTRNQREWEEVERKTHQESIMRHRWPPGQEGLPSEAEFEFCSGHAEMPVRIRRLLKQAGDRLIRNVEHSRELSDAQRSMVARQLLGVLAATPGEDLPKVRQHLEEMSRTGKGG